MNCLGRVTHLVSLLTCVAWVGTAAAQDYPSRMITLIVPYTPGGPTDTVARMLAPKLQEKLGQNVIVENISGGGTNIATAKVVNSAPDGHTLLIHNIQIAINVGLYPKLPFDVEKQLTAIAFVNNNAMVLVGRNSLPAKSLPELIAWMKTSSAKVGNPGIGSSAHLASMLLGQAIGAPLDPITYRGAAPVLQDIIGGHIDLGFGTPQQYIEPIKAGIVKGFGITAKTRLPQLPGVESMATAINPKMEILYWHALFAPAATPKPVIDKINTVLREVIADPAMKKAWSDLGMDAYPAAQQTVESAKTMLHSEIVRWTGVIRSNKIEISN